MKKTCHRKENVNGKLLGRARREVTVKAFIQSGILVKVQTAFNFTGCHQGVYCNLQNDFSPCSAQQQIIDEKYKGQIYICKNVPSVGKVVTYTGKLYEHAAKS